METWIFYINMNIDIGNSWKDQMFEINCGRLNVEDEWMIV